MNKKHTYNQSLYYIIRIFFGILVTALPATADQILLEGMADPEIDTPALQAAIDNHQPGDTLHLVGHFKIGSTIYTGDFEGVIKGDGKYDTIIEATGYSYPPYFEKVFFGNAMLLFAREASTDVTIKDLGLVYSALVCLNLADSFALVSMYSDPIDDANTTIKNTLLFSTDSTIDYGVALWFGSNSGDTDIVNCCVEGMVTGIRAEGPDNGKVSLTGNQISEVAAGVIIGNIPYGTLSIKENEIADAELAIKVRNIQGRSSIKNNAFNRVIARCILVEICSGVQVKNNHIENVTCPLRSTAAITLRNSSECVVEGNSFLHTTGFTGGILENDFSADNSFIANQFVDTRFRRHAISIKGEGAVVLDNDFYASGIPGDAIGPGWYRCITLFDTSLRVHVQQPLSLLPAGNPDPYTQVKDYAPEGANSIVYY